MKRRDLLQVAGAGAIALPLSAAAKLPDVILDPSKAKVTEEPFGTLRIYFEGPTDQLSMMTAGSLLLKAGMSPHPPHKHPEEEFLLITEGSGRMSIEDKMYKVGPGSMMYCAGDKLHWIENTGKNPLMFYFYKWQK